MLYKINNILLILYENNQYATQSRENKSRFHYLCRQALGKSGEKMKKVRRNGGGGNLQIFKARQSPKCMAKHSIQLV